MILFCANKNVVRAEPHSFNRRVISVMFSYSDCYVGGITFVV